MEGVYVFPTCREAVGRKMAFPVVVNGWNLHLPNESSLDNLHRGLADHLWNPSWLEDEIGFRVHQCLIPRLHQWLIYHCNNPFCGRDVLNVRILSETSSGNKIINPKLDLMMCNILNLGISNSALNHWFSNSKQKEENEDPCPRTRGKS